MQDIHKEVAYIGQRLSILSPNNPIENQQRERLLHRLDFFEYKIDCFLASTGGTPPRRHLRLIS